MNSDDAFRLLDSRRPSDRAIAAQWLSRNAEPSQRRQLLAAAEREPVQSIKRLLNIALRHDAAHDASADEYRTDSDRDASATALLLENLAGLIRHETEPAIGWVRRAAAREIEGFEQSETNLQIEVLRSRLEALETLAAAHRQPSLASHSLSTLVRDCMPRDQGDQLVRAHSHGGSDAVETDSNLFSIIIANALRNAFEATESLPATDSAVLVESSVSDRDFWITITNRFDGDGFDYEQIALSGSSSKPRHKGLGLSAMRIAADRLGYELDLHASGGTAIFTLRGPRRG